MHLLPSLGAVSAALLLVVAMPQPAQAREMVGFSEPYASGTIVVKTSERALYYVLGNGSAVRYPVGVGRAGKQWSGSARIDGKQLSPAWAPPAEIRRDKPSLPSPDSGRRAEQPDGRGRHDAERRGIRHPRHQPAELDRRLRVLRLHSHVQCGRARSLQPRQLGRAGGRAALKPG